MTEFLFEIFCEEIPARMQQRAGEDLSKALVEGLKKAGLTVQGEHCFTGPRRLVFTADIPLRSPDISEERKGPRVGSPEQALAGFMRGAGISDISEAEIRTDPKKGDFYVAVIEKSGADSADIIAQLIPEIMTNFPWPKSMKSGTSNFRWVRPLTSMICLLDGKVVDFEVGGVKTGNTTEGHRRHGKGPYTVKSFKDYRKQLEGPKKPHGHVMICTCERKDKILTDARAACKAKGLELVEDEGLLNEVAGLAEWPVVILGDMDKSFLELPDDVIRLTLKTHQKTFTVRDPKTGTLAPHYIIVANQIAPDGGEAIKKGNGKVISARLSDAQFFQSEDAKKKLIDYYDKLDTVVFHKKLGSIKDKAERVAALAKELALKVGADPDKAEQAAKLAKCDLVTQTVIEFTSLQGQIGAQMYRRENLPLRKGEGTRRGGEGHKDNTHSDNAAPHPLLRSTFSPGEKDSIATAIEQHYKPQGPSDAVPTNPVAVAVALADKLDTLVGFWAIDEKPTGSKDPFALRRAALGVVRIILENNVRLGLPLNFIKAFDGLYSVLREYKTEIEELYEQRVFIHFENSEVFNLEKFYEAIDREIEPNLSSKIDALGIFPEQLLIKILSDKPDIENRNLKIEGLIRYIYLSDVGNLPEVLQSLIDVEELEDRTEKLQYFFRPLAIDLFNFILERLKVHLRENGKSHDLIDATIGQSNPDLVSIVNRVEALQTFLDTPEGENLLAGYKRAANILKAEAKKGDLPTGAPDKPSEKESLALYQALQSASPKIETALNDENYTKAMSNLATLRAPIDAFFTHVQVISDDTAVKENNLRLLTQIRDTARQIADFDRING